jgi:hypothetical protein
VNKRSRGYMALLEERCEVLRNRIKAGESHKLNYLDNWRRELRAMEWALEFIEQAAERT